MDGSPPLFILLSSLIFLSQAASGPQPVHTASCTAHTSLHRRLDEVEKRVENTVQKLEAELEVLLDTIQALEWRPLLDTRGPTVDVVEGESEGMRTERGDY